jgi:hypothetical protein
VILDQSFKLRDVSIPGEGTYAVRVERRYRPSPWQRPRWRPLGTDYILVTRDT